MAMKCIILENSTELFMGQSGSSEHFQNPVYAQAEKPALELGQQAITSRHTPGILFGSDFPIPRVLSRHSLSRNELGSTSIHLGENVRIA